jgi:hypothetical protein
MRQIVMGAVNYAQAYKDKLPPHRISFTGGTDGGTRATWLQMSAGNPPTMSASQLDHMGILCTTGYLGTTKLFICPNMADKIQPNGTVRATYLWNPNPNGTSKPQFQQLSDFKRAQWRPLITDWTYTLDLFQHVDHKRGILQMNQGYSDGSVKQADSALAYQAMKVAGGNGVNSWQKLLEVIGRGSYIANGKGEPFGLNNAAPTNPNGTSPSSYYLYKNPAL